MALLTRAAALGSVLLLATACGAGETGRVEVQRAVLALDGADEASAVPLAGLMFSTRQSSRFEPDGLLLYFELATGDGSGVELEVDVPGEPGRDAVVRYSERSENEVTFTSDAAAGVVELAEDLDGRQCSCSQGRFDLRIADHGPDGQAGTDDDQLRELRNGVYYWDEQPCERDRKTGAVQLADRDRVEVRRVDACIERAQPRAAQEPPSTPIDGSDPRAGELRAPEHRYEYPPEREVYVQESGCGGGSGTETTGSGCGASGSAEPDSEASGCEGDSQSSESSSGCGSGSGSDGDDGSSGCGDRSDGDDSGSGCEGDEHDESSGCDSDESSESAAIAPPDLGTSAAVMCTVRARAHPLAGPLQNYLWMALGALFSRWRARRPAPLERAPKVRSRGEGTARSSRMRSKRSSPRWSSSPRSTGCSPDTSRLRCRRS